MQEISSAIAEGASAFLKSEYKILAVFILVLFVLIAIFINLATALCFVAGARLLYPRWLLRHARRHQGQCPHRERRP